MERLVISGLPRCRWRACRFLQSPLLRSQWNLPKRPYRFCRIRHRHPRWTRLGRGGPSGPAPRAPANRWLLSTWNVCKVVLDHEHSNEKIRNESFNSRQAGFVYLRLVEISSKTFFPSGMEADIQNSWSRSFLLHSDLTFVYWSIYQDRVNVVTVYQSLFVAKMLLQVSTCTVLFSNKTEFLFIYWSSLGLRLAYSR